MADEGFRESIVSNVLASMPRTNPDEITDLKARLDDEIEKLKEEIRGLNENMPTTDAMTEAVKAGIDAALPVLEQDKSFQMVQQPTMANPGYPQQGAPFPYVPGPQFTPNPEAAPEENYEEEPEVAAQPARWFQCGACGSYMNGILDACPHCNAQLSGDN